MHSKEGIVEASAVKKVHYGSTATGKVDQSSAAPLLQSHNRESSNSPVKAKATATAIPRKTRSRKSVAAFRKRKDREYDTWRGRIGVHVKVDGFDLKAIEEVLEEDLPGWSAVNHYDVIRVWQRPLASSEEHREAALAAGFSTDDSLHGEPEHAPAQEAKTPEVFLFTFGAAVFWNFPDAKAEDAWLSKHILCYPDVCGSCHEEGAVESASDDIEFEYGDTFDYRRDVCQLKTREAGEKLAVSFGIAKSSLLSVYEWMLEQTISRNSHIPRELARSGKIHMSNKALSQEVGRIFLVSHGINLDSNLQDTPEEFWEDDTFQDMYDKTLVYFEVEKRHLLVNDRLSMLHDLNTVMIEEVRNHHGARLEWIIIWLIVLEVVFEAYHAIFDVVTSRS